MQRNISNQNFSDQIKHPEFVKQFNTFINNKINEYENKGFRFEKWLPGQIVLVFSKDGKYETVPIFSINQTPSVENVNNIPTKPAVQQVKNNYSDTSKLPDSDNFSVTSPLPTMQPKNLQTGGGISDTSSFMPDELDFQVGGGYDSETSFSMPSDTSFSTTSNVYNKQMYSETSVLGNMVGGGKQMYSETSVLGNMVGGKKQMLSDKSTSGVSLSPTSPMLSYQRGGAVGALSETSVSESDDLIFSPTSIFSNNLSRANNNHNLNIFKNGRK